MIISYKLYFCTRTSFWTSGFILTEQEFLESPDGNLRGLVDFTFFKSYDYDEEEEFEATSARLVQEQGEYNQRLDLPNYQFPPISLLKKYDNGNTLIDQKELETIVAVNRNITKKTKKENVTKEQVLYQKKLSSMTDNDINKFLYTDSCFKRA